MNKGSPKKKKLKIPKFRYITKKNLSKSCRQLYNIGQIN